MTTPLPEQQPAGQRPESRYLGLSADGRHMYTHRDPMPCCSHQPQVRPPVPVGRYAAAAIGGAFLLIALMISLVLATICAVSLTCCLLVLRSMWREYRQERDR